MMTAMFAQAGLVSTDVVRGRDPADDANIAVTPEVVASIRDANVGTLLDLGRLDSRLAAGVVTYVSRPALSETVLRGRLEDDARSWFIFVVNGAVVVGEINSTDAGHSLLRRDAEGHVLRRSRSDDRLLCRTDELPLVRDATPPPPSNRARRGCPLLIDVMIVYTPSSRVALGGTAATLAVIDSYMAYTDMVFADSGVDHRFRLVHAAEVAYVESGNSLTDLDRLRNPADGFMDEVHALRDQFGADLVSLINTSGSAGVGYLMDELSTNFASSAFSAIGADAGPLLGGLVLAHETGHNMGLAHNNGGGQIGLFCYSYGHRTPDQQWRTIMSSSPGTFVDLFSSPSLSAGGFPLGISGDGCPPDAADAVRSLNEAAPTVAQFRPTMVPDGCNPSRGDLNCDGAIDSEDIDPFFLALGDAQAYAAAFPECDLDNADINTDGGVDAEDIDPFFACLSKGVCP